MRRCLSVVCCLCMVMVACSSSASESATTSETPVAKSSTLAPDRLNDVVRVTFDGQQCATRGPNEAAVGAVVPILLTNTSDVVVDVKLTRLRESGYWPESGKRTFEDLVEWQRDSGGVLSENYSEPEHRVWNWLLPEQPWFDRTVAASLAPGLDENQQLRFYRVTNRDGDDVLVVDAEEDSLTWICDLLAVSQR